MIQIGAPAATIDSPLEHLVACHRRIEQRLDTLVNAAAHIEKDRPAAMEAIGKSIRFLDFSGVLHTEDEERSLFPRLRPRLPASDLAFLDSLEADHTEAESIYEDLKQIVAELSSTSELPPEVVNRYTECAKRLRSLYREHICAEDAQLIGLASRHLSESEKSDMSREMQARRRER